MNDYWNKPPFEDVVDFRQVAALAGGQAYTQGEPRRVPQEYRNAAERQAWLEGWDRAKALNGASDDY